MLLKSDFGQLLLEGLKQDSEDVTLNVILTYSNLCHLLHETPVLVELKALDPLVEVLKNGSPKV
jgi:hypothetical protein